MNRVRFAVALCAAALVTATAVYAGSRQPDKEDHYVSKDRRLYLTHPKDMQGWKELKIDPEDEKDLVFKIIYKCPDSENNTDAVIIGIGYDHGMTLTHTDKETGAETKVKTDNVKKVAELEQTSVEKQFKVVKDREKLRKRRISRDAGKGYHCSFTGQIEKEPLPWTYSLYVFKAYQRTYILILRMPVNATEDKQTMDAVEKMIKGLRCWKP